MRYLSVCSGIEAASVAWHPLGWTPVAFSEIEPFPSAVLAHHYPSVPNWGDMTMFQEWPDAAVDVLVGGTPCQSFSVAGLRRGLDDPRGNLMLTYLAIARRYRPRWIVWENVPGVLSSGGGRDFGSFLGALGDLGYGWAYRVLDAQWFGVAQRRKRVFVVGCLGDAARAAAVLFERESVSRDYPPRRTAAEVAPTIPARSTAGGGLGTDFDCDGGVIRVARTGESRGQDPVVAVSEVYPTLDANMNRKWGSNQWVNNSFAVLQPILAHSLRDEGFDASEDGPGRGVPLVPVASSDGCLTPWDSQQKRVYNAAAAVIASTLSGSDGGGGRYPPAVAFQSSQSGVRLGDTHATLDANNGPRRQNGVMTAVVQPLAQPVATFAKTYKPMSSTDGEGWSPVDAAPTVTHWPRDRSDAGTDVAVVQPLAQPVDVKQVQWASGGGKVENDTAKALRSGAEYNYQFARIAMQVRRLTPVECERLQGFPDNYTNIPWRKKDESPDGPRYKALGNSMAVPCMAWIGRRIAERA